MAKRPPIPKELERAVLIEAGHRCAIAACRQTPVEIAHIIGWATCRTHEFHNLIPLCPTCHTRFDKGEIDGKSMRIYKHQLAMMNRRYGGIELRVLEFFAKDNAPVDFQLLADMVLFIQNLLDDKLLSDAGRDQPVAGGELVRKTFVLT
jgi:HNH endonuclease